MNFGKKKAAILLVAFVMVWVGNFYWYNRNLLKEPVFVKCYYDLQGNMPIRLHYFQNIADDYSIASISFPELDNQYVPCNEFEQGGTRGYKMKEIDIYFNSLEDVKRITKDKAVKLTKANVQFGNGKSILVNIGEIYLTPSFNDKPLFNGNSSYANSNNEGGTIVTANRNGVIKGINSKFSMISEMTKMELNGKVIRQTDFPIKFKTGDTITFKYNFIFKDENDIRASYFYKLSNLIECEDLEGRKSIEFIDIHYDPDINNIDVKKLEKERGNN